MQKGGFMNNETPKAKDFKSILEKHKVHLNKVDPSKDLEPPKIALKMKHLMNDKFVSIGSLGDFSLWTGKAKVGKSNAMKIITVTALKSSLQYGRFKSDLPENKKSILFIDTEQSDYHLNLSIKKICETVGDTNPSNLNVYGLRGTKPSDLKEIVEALIYTTENLGLVIIDGIKDLVGSINNEDKAHEITNDVERWSKSLEIHIITVLHENKSKTDDNARGFLGTELTNKAETIVNISNYSETESKIKRIKIIAGRNESTDEFYFRINEKGSPEQIDKPEDDKKTSKKQIEAHIILTTEEIKTIINKVLQTPLNSAQFIEKLKFEITKNYKQE
jgi:RecA-family ATPase